MDHQVNRGIELRLIGESDLQRASGILWQSIQAQQESPPGLRMCCCKGTCYNQRRYRSTAGTQLQVLRRSQAGETWNSTLSREKGIETITVSS